MCACASPAHRQGLADLDAVTLIDGRARFTAERTVQVTGGDDVLTASADVVIVNTGATPTRPDLPGIDSPVGARTDPQACSTWTRCPPASP